MKTETAVASGWDDLIFENRNKEYGAYDIRRSYSGNTTTAMIICLLAAAGILLLSGFSFFSKDRIVESEDDDGIIEISVVPPIEPIKPPAQRVIPPPSTELRDVQPIVTTEDVPDQPEVTTEPVSPAVEGTGDPNAGVEVYTGSISEGVGEPAVAEPAPTILDMAEVMPAYIGGLEEMARFLQQKLRYPLRAQRQEIEGTVFVGFVVNREGKVVDVKVIRGIHDDCDKEAVRVISMMPTWKAGSQKGIPVSVRMVLPVRFRMNRN